MRRKILRVLASSPPRLIIGGLFKLINTPLLRPN